MATLPRTFWCWSIPFIWWCGDISSEGANHLITETRSIPRPIRVITQKDLARVAAYQGPYCAEGREFVGLVRAGQAIVQEGELKLLDFFPVAIVGTTEDLERERQRLREQFNIEVNAIRTETNHSTASARSLQGLCDLADAIWSIDRKLVELTGDMTEYGSKVFFQRFRILLARYVPSKAISLLAA